MKNLIITLPEERMANLREKAVSLGTSPEELARPALQTPWDAPKRISRERHILHKNAELYVVWPDALSQFIPVLQLHINNFSLAQSPRLFNLD